MSKKETLHILTRVSTQNQVDKYSLPIQKEQGIKFSKKLKLKSKVYVEGGVSGGLELHKRPQLRKIMRGVESGEVKHIWVKDLSRLSRNNMTSTMCLGLMKDNGTTLYTQQGEFNFTKNNFDEVVYQMFSSFNTYKRNETRDKSMEGKVEHFKQGGWRGGTFPMGYKSINFQGKKMLVIEPNESKWIKKVFNWYDEGKTTKWIGQQLDSNGVKPRRSNLWSLGSIQSLLKNDLYIGQDEMVDTINFPLKPKKLYYKSERLQIIDEELFNRVRDKVGSMTQRRLLKRKHKYDVLLRGKMYCGDCGLLWGVSIVPKRYENIYRCPNKERKWRDKNKITPTCNNNKSMNITRTDDIVWNTLCEVLENSHIIKEEIKGKTLTQKLKTEEDVKKKIQSIRREQRKIDVRIDDIDERYEEVLGSYTNLEITKNILDSVLKKVDEEKRKLLVKKSDFDTEIMKVRDKKGWLDWINKHKGWIKDLSKLTTYKERVEVINQYVDKILVDYNRVGNTHTLVLKLKLPIVNDKFMKNKKGYEIKEGVHNVETIYSKKKIQI